VLFWEEQSVTAITSLRIWSGSSSHWISAGTSIVALTSDQHFQRMEEQLTKGRFFFWVVVLLVAFGTGFAVAVAMWEG
jgi:hypothetical protein